MFLGIKIFINFESTQDVFKCQSSYAYCQVQQELQRPGILQ